MGPGLELVALQAWEELRFTPMLEALDMNPSAIAAGIADALNYRDLSRLAIQLHTPLEEVCEVERRMVFNVLASNFDEHGKNHAFQLDEATRLRSHSPAYDLIFSSGIL